MPLWVTPLLLAVTGTLALIRDAGVSPFSFRVVARFGFEARLEVIAQQSLVTRAAGSQSHGPAHPTSCVLRTAHRLRCLFEFRPHALLLLQVPALFLGGGEDTIGRGQRGGRWFC